MQGFLVTRGEYDEQRVIAVVVGDQAAAQEVADRWNIDNIREVRGEPAEVHGETVPVYMSGGPDA
jgi:hypothetical protein